MNLRYIRRIIYGLVSFLIIVGAGLFLFRNVLLRSVAADKIASLSSQYNMHIAYSNLSMSSIGNIRLDGLTVVPHDKDTLLTLKRIEVSLDLLPLLGGNISVGNVDVDGMRLTFIKQKGCSNYEFLFRKTADTDEAQSRISESMQEQSLDCAARVKKSLALLFRLLPEDAHLQNLTVIGQRDTLQTRFFLPDMVISDNSFDAVIHVSEGDLSNDWSVSGKIDCGEKQLDLRMASAHDGRRIVIPYIRPHYNAFIGFDTICFSLNQKPEPDGVQTLTGDAMVKGVKVFHTALSPDTIDLNQGELDYTLHVRKDGIELDSLSCLTFNQLKFHPYLSAQNSGKWRFIASVHCPPFPAQRLFASLPSGLFRHLQGIEADGELSYDFLLDADFNQLDSLKFSSDLRGHHFRLSSLGTSDLTRMNDEFEYTAYDGDRPVRTFMIGPSNPSFRPLDRISPLLQMAVMQSEDGSFFYHQGFYPGAIQEALAYDLQVGRFARGGSSITMQLVKNVFLNKHKNIARKLEEALIVWLIENQHLTSKERMYEVYLNIAEWGPMVYGAAEASHFYFKKEPSELTAQEAIFMASVIPRPKHFYWSFNADGTLRDNQEGYFRILARRLAAKGMMTEEQAESLVPNVEITGPAYDLIIRKDSLTVQPTDSLTIVE